MYGIFHIRSVSVGLDGQIWYLFIYITGYLNVRKISETIDLRTFVGPRLCSVRLLLQPQRKTGHKLTPSPPSLRCSLTAFPYTEGNKNKDSQTYSRYRLICIWQMFQSFSSFFRSSLWSISRLTLSPIDLESRMILANLRGATTL